ncbi:hypothetical protein QOT17_004751 [Balamuthia mandrillaris]
MGEGKSGWLQKKGKRRWFVIHNNILYWFAKEQKAVTSTFHHTGMKGCLELRGCQVTAVEKPSSSFQLSSTATNNSYTLTAANAALVSEWMTALQAAIADANTAKPPSGAVTSSGSFSASALTSSSSSLPAVGEQSAPSFSPSAGDASVIQGKRGTLQKKGANRIFVLNDDSLVYFAKSGNDATKAKGGIALQGAVCKAGSKPNSFLVLPEDGRRFELFAPGGASECSSWIEAINTVIARLQDQQREGGEKTGFLEKKGQKRWFMVKDGKLCWYSKVAKTEHDTPNGTLSLKMVDIPPHDHKLPTPPIKIPPLR